MRYDDIRDMAEAQNAPMSLEQKIKRLHGLYENIEAQRRATAACEVERDSLQKQIDEAIAELRGSAPADSHWRPPQAVKAEQRPSGGIMSSDVYRNG